MLDLSTSRSSGHVSGTGEGQWPLTSCGRTEEVAGDWWAGFVAGNGRVHLEEQAARDRNVTSTFDLSLCVRTRTHADMLLTLTWRGHSVRGDSVCWDIVS